MSIFRKKKEVEYDCVVRTVLGRFRPCNIIDKHQDEYKVIYDSPHCLYGGHDTWVKRDEIIVGTSNVCLAREIYALRKGMRYLEKVKLDIPNTEIEKRLSEIWDDERDPKEGY